ncbi:MFS transporter [Stutzerimonas azotifigens]|uniref:MFS transporter n=1 Tax=Stutzerimonas azotifigens TaxID=291995 RepID=UPI0003F559C4|nr:MFS transporter [Stutzerimonas azotifigens]
MDALLILGGLLLILAGLVWLVCLAFDRSPLWGLASLLPPLTLLFVIGHWRVARKALVVVGLGFVPLVVGLSLLANQDSERFAQLVSLRWLDRPEQPAADANPMPSGRLQGQPFRPQSAELIGGTLRLREGEGVFPRREIAIDLGAQPDGSLALDILPQDRGALPQVHIGWLEEGSEQPEARRLGHGYTLHLALERVPPNRLVGDLHLVLPPDFDTLVSGRLEAFTDRLRYRDGQIDRHHDSRDTLAYVLGDYLQRRFSTRDVRLEPLPPVAWPTSRVQLSVTARVAGKEQTLDLGLAKGEQGWEVVGDHYAALPEVAPGPVAKVAAPVAPPKAPAPAVADLVQDFSLERLLAQPAQYRYKRVRAHTERGGVAEGRFEGLDAEGRLSILRLLKGPGAAVYQLAPGEIVLLELIEP